MKENILIVRVGRLGDMIMVTAAIRALLDKYPEAEFQVLTSADGKRVLRDFDPRITAFLHYDRRHLLPFWHRRQLAGQIRAANFSQIYCFETKPSFYALWAGTSAKTHLLKIDPDSTKNYALWCLDLVLAQNSANHTEPRYWINLPVSQAGRDKLQALLDRSAINKNSLVIGLHPSFSGLAKNPLRRGKHAKHKIWPNQHWADLARQLVAYGKQHGLSIQPIIDLLPDEAALGESINALCHQQITVFTEAPDFARYKALLERMDLLVCPDTGPMHLAAAIKTPVVALFSGKDPRDCGPFAPPDNYHVLRAEDSEQPEQGLAAITPETVLQACLEFITSRKGSSPQT